LLTRPSKKWAALCAFACPSPLFLGGRLADDEFVLVIVPAPDALDERPLFLGGRLADDEFVLVIVPAPDALDERRGGEEPLLRGALGWPPSLGRAMGVAVRSFARPLAVAPVANLAAAAAQSSFR
jgi:DNA-binding transcriptional LysR family regulator